ncbi:MAG TPA: hypothetical protein VK927_09695 [Adhaeribacter sp.]|nr:hypothetical protein [Adhaeribacter sp.]
MSDLPNSIFDNEKEFLERQKLEYKNALMSDVAVVKDRSEKLGRGVLLAGGVLAGVWLVTKMVSGPKKKKKKKKAKARKLLQTGNQRYAEQAALENSLYNRYGNEPDQEVNFGSPLDFNQPLTDEGDSSFYNTPAKYFDPTVPVLSDRNYALHQHYHAGAAEPKGPSVVATVGSELVRAVVTQVSAFLLVYLSQKVEAYLSKNADIAGRTEPETQDTDFIYNNADAGTHL